MRLRSILALEQRRAAGRQWSHHWYL